MRRRRSSGDYGCSRRKACPPSALLSRTPTPSPTRTPFGNFSSLNVGCPFGMTGHLEVINAEKAAFQARVFVEKRHRTNDTLLKDMYMEYLKECNKVKLGATEGNPDLQSFNKVTDTVIKHLRSPIRKEAPKESIDFCKLGELIKLEKMLSGDVSDSVKMTTICRKQVCAFNSFGVPLLALGQGTDAEEHRILGCFGLGCMGWKFIAHCE